MRRLIVVDEKPATKKAAPKKPTAKAVAVEASAAEVKADNGQSWTRHWPTVVAVVSVLATLWIYHAQRDDAQEFMRRSTAVQLVSMRYSSNILSAEKNLNDYILKNYEQYARAENAESEDDKPEVQLSEGVRSDFMLMVDFYSDVLVCRESQQCEKVLIDQWFKDDICQFMNLGEMIGFPQLRDQYGDAAFKRLDAFKASGNCDPAAQPAG